MKKVFFCLFVVSFLASCSGVTHLFTVNGAVVTEQISKNGYYLQQDLAVHTEPLQYDTFAVRLIGPDSVANQVFQKVVTALNAKYNLNPFGGRVSEQITKNGFYLQEDVAIHTLPFQYDTVAIMVIGPDSVSNKLFQKIVGDIKGKL